MCFVESNNTKIRNKCMIDILNPFTKNNDTFRNYILVNKTEYMKIPRGICQKEFEICKSIKHPKNIDFEFEKPFEMKPEQLDIVNSIKTEFETKKIVNTIIVRPTAFGKTFTAVNIISELKMKTLVVVNRDSLVKQWQKQCQSYFPKNTIGLLQGKIRDTHADIIISTVQSISLKSDISETFLNKLKIGILILDEIHTMSADRFIQVLFKTNMPVRIGLTATLERPDQKELLICQHFNYINKIQDVKKQQTTQVCFIKTGYIMTTLLNQFTDKLNFSEMLNQLAYDEQRNLFLVETIKRYLKDSNKILVVSDRINQLKFLHGFFPDNSCLCTSKHKPDFTKQIIFGIVSIVGTGLNVPDLNVLVFAMPKKNIIQIIGRVFRRDHSVYIIDPIDTGNVCMGQKRKRLVQYHNQIENLEIINL